MIKGSVVKGFYAGLLILLVSACTPETGDPTEEPSRVVEQETKEVSTPTMLPEPSPRETQTPPPNKTPIATPAVDPTVTIEEDYPFLDDSVIISLHQEGGFAGVDITWLIYADGGVEQDGQITGDLDEETIQLLLDKIEGSGFFDMSPVGDKDVCCDFFTYTLTVINGDSKNSITISEADPEMPPGLEAAILMILQAVTGTLEG